MRKIFFLFSLFSLLFLLASCQTEVDTRVERPAALDIGNSKSITIVPFKGSTEMSRILNEDSKKTQIYRNIDGLTSSAIKVDDEKRIAAALTEALETQFERTNRFTVIPSTKSGTNSSADLVVSGGLTYFGTSIQSEQRQTTDKKGGNAKRTTYYWRDITLSVFYSVFNEQKEILIDEREVKYNLSSDPTTERSFVPEAADMAIDKVKELAKQIVKDFIPYSEDLSLSLLFHKDTEMKTASMNAQIGKLDIAKEQYEKIYANKGYFEAGYNTAVLLQANGDLTSAYNVMNDLYSNTGDKRAKKALEELSKEIEAKEKLKTQKY